MSYTVNYRGKAGMTGLYASIVRRSDEYWFNETTQTWVSAVSAACRKTLAEDGTIKGYYTGSSLMAPAPGEIYAIYVYDSSDILLLMTEDMYSPTQKTALQIVNTVQKKLRLPQTASGSFATDPHAQLILSFANQAMMDMITDAFEWDEMKLAGAFGTRDGIAVYTIYPVNGASIGGISRLQIGGDDPFDLLNDSDFRNMKNIYTVGSTPLFYRIYARAGNALVIEILPVPDAVYVVEFEGMQRPDELSAYTDIPLLDPDTIIAGALMLARKDQGEDYTLEMGAFQAKLSLKGRQTEAAWGDVLPT